MSEQQQPIDIDFTHYLISMIQQTKNEMQNKLQQLSTHVEALEVELRNSKEGEKKALAAVAELSTRLETNETKTTGLETKTTGLETEMTGLKTQVTGIENGMAGLATGEKFDQSSFHNPLLME